MDSVTISRVYDPPSRLITPPFEIATSTESSESESEEGNTPRSGVRSMGSGGGESGGESGGGGGGRGR